MWKKAFTEIESAQFAEDHVKVFADLTSKYDKDISTLDIHINQMMWAVRII